MISIRDGVRTRGEILELETLGPEDLAQVDDLIHEMRDHLDRVARVRDARAKAGGGL
jgi:hypothetical protein